MQTINFSWNWLENVIACDFMIDTHDVTFCNYKINDYYINYTYIKTIPTYQLYLHTNYTYR